MSILVENAMSENGNYMLSEESLNLVRDIESRMDGSATLDDIKKKNKGRFKFPIYIDEPYMDRPVSCLDVSIRAYNGLRRGRIKTVRDVVNKIYDEEDLMNMQGVGAKSAAEILFAIFLYQYKNVNKEKKDKYVNRVLELNGIRW